MAYRRITVYNILCLYPARLVIHGGVFPIVQSYKKADKESTSTNNQYIYSWLTAHVQWALALTTKATKHRLNTGTAG